MRTAPYIQALWNRGGPFIGESGKAHSIVTIQTPYSGDILHEVNAGNYATRGEPVRWYQALANDQTEVEVPNVKSIVIDRSIEQDAAVCEIIIYNQQMYANGAAPVSTRELGQPGFFTADRGKSLDAQARWGYSTNEWADAFVPDALLRTWQGFGGHDKTREQCLADGNLILTGVWLVDDVAAATDGTLRLKCRDMAKLLIEQQLYLPLIPADHYPLKYYRWAYYTDAVRASSRSASVNTTNPGFREITYSDSASDRWYGYNADIHGHHPLDATDGNLDTYWLSVGNDFGDSPWAYDWLEYNVGADINSIYMYPWAGNFQMFVSVMVDGVWQGDDVIPYDYAALVAGEPWAVDTGANIPYVMQCQTAWESGQNYNLPQMYHADKFRVTFHLGTWTEWGPWHYRSGVREIGALVAGDGPGGQSTVTYAPLFLAAGSAVSGVGYITSDTFGDIDAFGDARSLSKTGGNPVSLPGDNVVSLVSTGGGATPHVGYYELTQLGAIYCYGDAPDYNDPQREHITANFADIALTPSGNGYWCIDTLGEVFAFGDATNFGLLPYAPANGPVQYTSIEGHPTQMGYWALRSDGVVFAMGACTNLGNWDPSAATVPLGPETLTTCLRCNRPGTGYWIMSDAGEIQAFGAAVNKGGILFSFSGGYGPVATADWFQKFWKIIPAADGGYLLMRGDGQVFPIETDYFFGSPIPGGVTTLRTPGNYLDYADIITDLALWSGFYLYDPNLPANEIPSVYGNIESTGAYAPEPLPDSLFDKKPVIDAMHSLKEVVGYLIWVDDQGAFHFESANVWGPGNFDEFGVHLDYIPEIDERLQLTGYSSQQSDASIRSSIIISSEDPDQSLSSTITTRVVPTDAPKLRGILKPAMWVNSFFQSPDEQRIMAELIALHIHFASRQGQVECVANPAIGLNDQVRIWERQSGESFVHYVRGVHTEHDLETGVYTMTLTTHWLGDETEWAVRGANQGASPNGFELSPGVQAYIESSPAGATASFTPQISVPPPTYVAPGGGTPDAGGPGAGTPPPPPPPTPLTSGGAIYWGAWIEGQQTYAHYYGGTWGNAPWDANTWNRFEQNAEKKVSLVHYGQPPPWEQAFLPSVADLVTARGAIPFMDMGSRSVSLTDITAGIYDSALTTWANAVASWGKSFFLRWDWEMNGTWFPWGAQAASSPANFVAAWRHFHDIVSAAGANNVTWVWCPNVEPASGTSLTSLYPGDAYVDWTGMDGYNWGLSDWESFGQIFSQTYHDLLALAPTKPIMIGETASVETGGSKAAWITDALTSLPSSYPAIRALVWFNWRILERGIYQEWPIESSDTALAAFRSAISSSTFTTNTFGSGTGKVTPP